ncbi:MAG: hypothetical protein CEE38_17810 [Planctomycetes bacterium B3_Pla]|nr:MAG: hypothetical protein CEE38_17810 [Planctomycetes bacterium B3_Pla]
MTKSTSKSKDVLSAEAIKKHHKLTSDAVLAATPGVLASPAIKEIIRCPKTITVDVVKDSDPYTHKIYASQKNNFSTGPFEYDHFVTVKGTGDIIIRARINPDTQQVRSQLTWEAEGATIISPGVGNDTLTAKVSRETKSGKKIVVKIKIGKKECKEFTIWIIWCKLTGNISSKRTSVIPDPITKQLFSLGLQQGHFSKTYTVRGGIEWTATIYPSEIITGWNRPDIEGQYRIDPPGSGAGVAGDISKDGTDSGFSGWDMSRQKRRKVWKGNTEKNPPTTIFLATKNDNDERDRLITNYPTNDAEGNDDTNTSFSDSNPYGAENGAPIGKLLSYDRPSIGFGDAINYNGGTPADDGDTFKKKLHLREFVRVQLGSEWYRCSDWGKWRFHVNLKRQDGKWGTEPGQKNILELNNKYF